jgi:hypothetical protein
VGKAGTTFQVTTVGFPSPALTIPAGALPSNLTFTDNHDGTATLSGTPAVGTGKTYNFTITASNGVGTPAAQSFTLVVNEAPTVTSPSATQIGTISATLNAVVNANNTSVAATTGCYFVIGTAPGLYGATQYPCIAAQPASFPLTGNSPVAVSASVPGLVSNTIYYFEVAVTNDGGTNYGTGSFTTESVITYTGPSGTPTYGDSFTPNPTGDGQPGGTVTIGVSGQACSLDGGTVKFTGVGACTVTYTETGNGTYATQVVTEQITNVAPKAQTVTASSGTMTFGGTVPTITPSFNGLVPGNTPAVTCSTTATSASAPGPYPSSCALTVPNSAPDYSINFVPGIVTVGKAQTTTTVTCVTPQTYTGSAITPCTATVTGAGGLNQLLPAASISYTNNLTAGTATASASFAGDSNYSPSSGTANFTITYGITNVYPPNKTTFQKGSTIPVKFQLTDNKNKPIPSSLAQSISNICNPKVVSTKQATVQFDGQQPPVCAVYNASSGIFQANLMTPKKSGSFIITISYPVNTATIPVSTK